MKAELMLTDNNPELTELTAIKNELIDGIMDLKEPDQMLIDVLCIDLSDIVINILKKKTASELFELYNDVN